MAYIVLILGLFIFIWGLYHLTKFIYLFSQQQKRLEVLMKKNAFESYETLRHELDELNYSYYEVLEGLLNRMDTLERSHKDHTFDHEKTTLKEASVLVQKPQAEKKQDPQYFSVSGEKEAVIRLIEQNFTDQEIAKILNVGTGKIMLIRSLNKQNTVSS